MQKMLFLCISWLCWQQSTMAQKIIPLYKQIPNSKVDNSYVESQETGKDGTIRVARVKTPTLTVYKPDPQNNAHTAVIICPGGGYSILAINKEGTDVAQAMAAWGITAFVLKYRLPSDQIMDDKSIGPLQDAQKAIQMVRAEASKWDIDPAKIGIMGFSAGGHLAATASTHYNRAVIDNPENVSLRPDFSILGYPVISMEPALTHKGSRDNLLGSHPDSATAKAFSNELQVTEQTPPTFLVLASDDNGVRPANSLRYYEALLAHKVPASLQIYQNGGHGFGMGDPKSGDQWMNRLQQWLQHNHFLPDKIN